MNAAPGIRDDNAVPDLAALGGLARKAHFYADIGVHFALDDLKAAVRFFHIDSPFSIAYFCALRARSSRIPCTRPAT